MTDRPTHQSTDAWARYWQAGALHSCATSFDGNYQGAIADFWRTVFAGLAAGDRVLDIATGNGALPQLLLQQHRDADVSCDAVDLAPVAPAWQQALPETLKHRIRIHGGVAAEALPFADGEFTLVVSQYGIEYADRARALAEVRRVLARPGAVGFVVHHAGSRPVTLARDEIAHIDWLLAPGGLMDASAAMLEPMARARTPAGRESLGADAAANAARDHFNVLQRELGERARQAICPDVLLESRQAIAHALEGAIGIGEPEGKRRLADWRIALADNRTRLVDLCACAMDESALHEWLRALGADETRVETLHEAGALMGWAVRARLAPAA